MSIYAVAVAYLQAAPILAALGLVTLAMFVVLKSLPTAGGLLRGFDLVEPSLARLLRQGLNSGHLTIRHKKSARIIEFRKYIRSKGDYGLALSLAETAWSQEDLAALRAYCEETGLVHDVNPGDGKSIEDNSIDFGQDLDKALALATMIWTKVFRLPTSAPCVVKLRDCDPWCDLVDSPTHSRENSLRAYNRRQKQEGSVTVPGAILGTGLVVMLVTAVFGLPLSTMAALDARPDWSVELAGVVARGSTASLTFAGLLLISYVAIQIDDMPPRKGTRPPRRNARLIRWGRVTLQIGLVALVASVVIVWLGP